MQTSQLRPLGWALLMRHKDANAGHKDANQSVEATWLGFADAPQGCKRWALLIRHKDANQSVKATWLGACSLRCWWMLLCEIEGRVLGGMQFEVLVDAALRA